MAASAPRRPPGRSPRVAYRLRFEAGVPEDCGRRQGCAALAGRSPGAKSVSQASATPVAAAASPGLPRRAGSGSCWLAGCATNCRCLGGAGGATRWRSSFGL